MDLGAVGRGAAGHPRAAAGFEGDLLSPPICCLHLPGNSKVMLNPGLTVKWASQISCRNLLREIFSKEILAIVGRSKCGLRSLFLVLGFLGEQSHIPSKCCLVIGIFLSRSQHDSDTKFILILDRRLDTWTSVKMTLQKIAVSPL